MEMEFQRIVFQRIILTDVSKDFVPLSLFSFASAIFRFLASADSAGIAPPLVLTTGAETEGAEVGVMAVAVAGGVFLVTSPLLWGPVANSEALSFDRDIIHTITTTNS